MPNSLFWAEDIVYLWEYFLVIQFGKIYYIVSINDC